MPSPLNITRFYILFEQTINIIESWLNLFITALFTNMRILKFKSQLTIAFFTAVNHLNEPLRKQNFTLTGSKGHGWWFVIGGFRSVLCVSVSFKGRNYDWRQRKTQLWRRVLNFRVRMFVKSAVIHCFEENNDKYTLARNVNWYCYWKSCIARVT